MPFRGHKQPIRDSFHKFTERARRVMTLAAEEARRLRHHYIGTEHLLLGLIREGDGVAAQALRSLNVDLPSVRASVEAIIGRGDRAVSGDVGLTPRSKKVINLAIDEARRLNHNFIGTEHILLGIIREGEGIGARVLEERGLTLEQVRAQVQQVLLGRGAIAANGEQPRAGGGPKTNVVTCRLDDRTLDAVDALVEAGIRPTRSDAAAWLISAGLDANRSLIDRVYATVTEIRRLRQEAWTLAHDAIGEGEPPPDEPGTNEPLDGDVSPGDEAHPSA